MRRFLSLLTMFMLVSILAFAQSRVVSGKVIDAGNGKSIPFASIVVSSGGGTQADANGEFTVKAKTSDVLTVSFTGFESATVLITNQNTYNVALKQKEGSLETVVVTSAFGRKTAARSSTSNVQLVSSEQLNVIRQTNLNNALAGKVAGVQVRSQSIANLGRDASVRLRGEGSLYGSTVLYVVDGTVVNSNDINNDDIEDITVLNGPSAAALFGAAASNGAIVINTKRGRKNAAGIGLEINSGVQFDKVYILPNYQNSYAGGAVGDLMQYHWSQGQPVEWKALDGKYYHDYSDDASWGPRMVGQEYIPWYAWYPGSKYSYKTALLTPQPNNARDYFNTGVSLNNNISFSKASDNYSARISYTNVDVKGLVPNSFLKKNTLATNLSFDLSSRFTASANITYVNQRADTENDDTYSNQSTGSFNSWFHRDLDMGIMKELRGLTSPEGILASWNHKNPGSYSADKPVNFYGGNYWYNFYSYYDNVSNVGIRDRIYGDFSLTYKATPNLKFKATVRKNQVTTNFEHTSNYLLEISATQTGQKADYSTNQTYYTDNRGELTANYNKKFGNINVNLIAGSELVKIMSKSIGSNTRNGLYIPDFFVLSNSIDNAIPANSRSLEKRSALFTSGELNYKNFLFGNFTVRNDWYSTLPKDNNSILVKSFGAGLVFSEFTKNVFPLLSYGKIRASWGQIPEAISPYLTNLYYGVAADQWNGLFIMGTPNQIPSPTIRGAIQTSKEAGIDLRFWKSKFGISGTYYERTTKNSPVAVQINGASGFSSKLINAGMIQSNGIELQMNLRPFSTGKFFNWELNATYAQILKNTVVDIAPDVNQIVISSGAAFNGITPPIAVNLKGQTWGMIQGGGKKFINGKPVLDADGFFVKDDNPVNFGSTIPKYTGGVQNTFTFGNIVCNVNIDYQWGGKFFSLSDMWGSFSGLTARTATLNDRGISIRDRVADGGGVHVFGVDEGGKDFDKYVEAQDYFHNIVNRNVFNDFIYDLTFVKLRELSLGYKIPVNKIGASRWLQNATFSIVARNPWLIYSTTKDFDPSEVVNTYGEDGQLPGTRSLGINLRLGF